MKRIGKRTIVFENNPCITGYGSVVGKKEHEGPLSNEFDAYTTDSFFGEKSFEKAESKLQKTAVQTALDKAGLTPDDIDNIFAGDLLNQCISSNFGLVDFHIPFFGLYGACSTFVEGMILAAMAVHGGYAKKAVAITSSHFCSSERQYRFPLEYGGQRTPTAQWTVTGSGCCIVSNAKKGACIARATAGKIVDLGVTDANNMGAAMAPAAAQTFIDYFADTNTKPSDYDAVFTGDLGLVGSRSLYDLLSLENIDLEPKHYDCGMMIFDLEGQDVHAGGSGCGCAGSVFCSEILNSVNSEIQQYSFHGNRCVDESYLIGTG